MKGHKMKLIYELDDSTQPPEASLNLVESLAVSVRRAEIFRSERWLMCT